MSAASIEDIILILECSKDKRRGANDWGLTHFKGLYPILGDFTDLTLNKDMLIPFDTLVSDVPRNVDVAAAYPSSGNNGFTITRVRRRTAKQLRGKVPGGYQAFPLFEMAVGIASADLPNFAGTRVFAKTPRDWVTVWPAENKNLLTEWGRTTMQAALGLEFIRPFYWHATVSIDGGLPVRFFTDPTGASEIFRLRDVPPGKKRRAALRTWISGHWRTRVDGGISEVVKHLRGATTFDWSGMSVTLEPSSDDIKIATELKQEREERRKAEHP